MVMPWEVEILNDTVAAEIRALPADVQARFLRLGDRIRATGLETLREPHVKHLEGKLWEMRLSARDGIARQDRVADRHRGGAGSTVIVNPAAVDAGVLLRPLGDVVVVMPPLTVTADEIDRIVATLAAAISGVAGAGGR